MRIRFEPGPIKESPASGHLFRFAMGGAVTTCTGLLAKAAGPKVEGLFLALPAILPTGIAFIAKLQNKKLVPACGAIERAGPRSSRRPERSPAEWE